VGPCNRSEGRVCAKKGESVSVVKERKGRNAQVHQRTILRKGYIGPQSYLKWHQCFVGKKDSKKHMV